MKKSGLFLFAFFFVTFCLNVCYAQSDAEMNCDDNQMVIKKTNSKGDTTTTTMQLPRFDDGEEDLSDYIAEHLTYPEELKSIKAEGTCTVQFIVGVDGEVSEAQVVESSGYPEMDDEAVRLVESFPNWHPAAINGNPISMKTRIPVQFFYEEDEE